MLFLGFLALAALLRIPTYSNHVFNADEAYLATEAQIINDGGHLYTDAVDRKPPVVPYLYAATFAVTGTDDLAAVRVLAVLAHALDRVAARGRGAPPVLGPVRRRRGRRALPPRRDRVPPAGRASRQLRGVHAAADDRGDGVGRAPSTRGGGRDPRARDPHQADGGHHAPAARVPGWKFRHGRGLALLAVAFAAPVLVAAAIFGFHDFFFWVFTGSGGYLDASGALGYAAGLGAKNTAWFLFGSAALIVLAASAWKHWRDDADLWLWVVSGMIAVAAGLRFFPHYYLQVIPPLALLAGRGLSSHAFFTRRTGIALVAVLALVPVAYHLPAALEQRTDRNLAPRARRGRVRARAHEAR